MTIDVALLIELVQHYSFLYDKTRKDFKDIVKKNNAWEEIAETLGCSVDEVKTRWRTLRERFVKEMKLMETKSGQATNDEESQWEWFQSLLFLNDHVRPRKTTSNILCESSQTENEIETVHIDIPEESESESGLFSPSCSTVCNESTLETPARGMGTKRKRNISKTLDIDKEVLSTLRNLEKAKENIPAVQENEDDLFCRTVACELKKITNVSEKQRRKVKIYMIATGLEEL